MTQRKKTNVSSIAADTSDELIPDYEPAAAVDLKSTAAVPESSEKKVAAPVEVPAVALRRDSMIMKKKVQAMKDMFKNSPKVTFRPSKGYAPIFGRVWTFMFNLMPVSVRFDGSPQVFPEPVYLRILEKLGEGLEAAAPKDVTTKIK